MKKQVSLGFMVVCVLLALFVDLFTHCQAYAKEGDKEVKVRTTKHSHPCISGGAKNTVFYIGQVDKDQTPIFNGTAFLISYEGHPYAVTAKHVVAGLYENLKDDQITFFHNTKDGKGTILKQDWIMRRTNSKWIFSENSDVAIMPYVLPENIEFRLIPLDFFVTSDNLMELEDAFYISYQPGLESPGRITPIVRSGTISIINDDNSFILDAFVFPGNSGSPVFVKPSVAYDDISASQSCKFIGLVSSYLTYQDVAVSAQTRQPRIIFEENTGLAYIISAQAVLELLGTEAFKQQHKIYQNQIKNFVK